MNIRRTLFLAGAALVALPTAGHACSFSGQNSALIGPLLGDASATGGPVAVGQLADAFLSKPVIRSAFERSGCTAAEVKAKIVALNGGNPAEMLARSGAVVYPTPDLTATAKPAPAAAPAAPAPVATAAAPQTQFESKPMIQSIPAATAPVAAPAPKPTSVVAAPLPVRPLPEQFDASDIWNAVRALQSADTEIRSELSQVPPAELTSEQLTLVSNLGEVPDLIQKLKDLPASGVVQTASLTPEELAAVKQLLGAQTLAEEYVSRDFIDFSALLGGFGFILLSLLGGFAFWKRNKNIAAAAQAAVATELAEVRLDDTFKTTVLADIAGLKSDVTGLKSRFKHDVKKATDTLEPAEMKALADGTEFEYHLLVDGLPVTFDAKVVQHTPSGDALIKVDELPNPVTAKNLRGELADYFEKGGALPALKLVNTP